MKTFRQVGDYSLVKFEEDLEVGYAYHNKDNIYSTTIDQKEFDRIINLCDEDFLRTCVELIQKAERIRNKNYDLAQEILSKTNIGIVTCGHCGVVNLHKHPLKLEDEPLVEYEGCGHELNFSDCPDLYLEEGTRH